MITRRLCLVALVLSVSSVAFGQQVTLKGQYANLDGDQLPINSANGLSVVVFDDNGNRIPTTIERNVKSRGGATPQPDEYSITFQGPAQPNRTVSVRFAAPDRETVTIPRILARGDQTLHVVLREAPAQSGCCSCQNACVHQTKVRFRCRR